MQTIATQNPRAGSRRRWKTATVIVLGITLLAGACMPLMMLMHGKVERPAPQEFGLGPRASYGGTFRATIEPAEPLRKRKLMSVRLRVEDAAGQAIDGATIAVDGGMPQHGHGLPTQPRVTRAVADGVYEVQGVRFNMGGWWELKFRVTTAAGTDSVTFNIEL